MTTAAKKDRRGRGPSDKKTAETRSAILAAALRCFLSRGFVETRMADVAELAGLAKGTLYLYFEDKEALFEGVLAEAVGGPITAIRSLTPSSDETVKAFLLRELLPFLSTMESSGRADIVRLLVREAPRFPSMAEQYKRLVLEPLSGFIRQMSGIAVARGELATDALTRFPLLLVSPGLMAMIWNGIYGGEDPIDIGEAFTAYLELIWPDPQRR